MAAAVSGAGAAPFFDRAVVIVDSPVDSRGPSWIHLGFALICIKPGDPLAFAAMLRFDAGKSGGFRGTGT
jgi:hypothetical protein